MTNDSNSAITQGQQANDFTLEGQNKQIHFSATSFSGVPLLSYKDEEDESNNRDFRGDEIDILETAFGKLVTVTIAHVPDLHIVYLTVLIPTVYLPKKGEEFSIETIAIITTHNTPFTGPQGNPDGLQVDTYETIDLEGTARFIVS